MSLANPQLEDGHLKIANSIAETLAHTQMSGHESRVLWFLFRKTYGWSKKTDVISLSQWMEGTGLSKSHVVDTLNRLVVRKIIRKAVPEIGNRKSQEYWFNKHANEWKVFPKTGTFPKSGILLFPKSGHTTAISTTTEKYLKDLVEQALLDTPPSTISKPKNSRRTSPIDDPVVALYTKICVPKGLPNVKALTINRQRAIKRATADYGLERLEALFKKAVTSEFLLGRTQSMSHQGWKADFDFLLRGDTLVHIDEGSRYFGDVVSATAAKVLVTELTPEQDAKHKQEARRWLMDEKAKEEAR